MDHARSCGASVYELTRVTCLKFSETDPSRPISASWKHTPSTRSTTKTEKNSPITGSTTFDYLIDATGRTGIISTRYLKNRYFNEALKNIAVWGYWEGAGSYGAGTERAGAPWFEALTGL